MSEQHESAAIVGAAGTLRTLVDGSVRLYIDYEPKDAKAVMAAFGAPGTPIATVRLREGFAAKDDGREQKTSFRDLGPICREAIDLCGNQKFQEYVAHVKRHPHGSSLSDAACKQFVCITCNVESRKELDTAEGARELFIAHIRQPFQRWLRESKA